MKRIASHDRFRRAVSALLLGAVTGSLTAAVLLMGLGVRVTA